MIHRRNLLVGLIAAPAIVRYASIMPVRALGVVFPSMTTYSADIQWEIGTGRIVTGITLDGSDVVMEYKNGIFYYASN